MCLGGMGWGEGLCPLALLWNRLVTEMLQLIPLGLADVEPSTTDSKAQKEEQVNQTTPRGRHCKLHEGRGHFCHG